MIFLLCSWGSLFGGSSKVPSNLGLLPKFPTAAGGLRKLFLFDVIELVCFRYIGYIGYMRYMEYIGFRVVLYVTLNPKACFSVLGVYGFVAFLPFTRFRVLGCKCCHDNGTMAVLQSNLSRESIAH